jgi:basic membrane lipoprotein Med (substrate-binding protein (PBP1-ABC) superfamily)
MIGAQCKAAIDGTFVGGKVIVNGLKSGVVGLTKVYNEPADVQAAVDKATKAIEDGTEKGVPEIAPGIPSTGPESN